MTVRWCRKGSRDDGDEGTSYGNELAPHWLSGLDGEPRPSLYNEVRGKVSRRELDSIDEVNRSAVDEKVIAERDGSIISQRYK